MAPAQKRRARHTDVLSYLNNVNNPDALKSPARKAPRRRHTTHRAHVYDIPVSSSPDPQPEPEPAPRNLGRTLRSHLRGQYERHSTPAPDVSHDEDDRDEDDRDEDDRDEDDRDEDDRDEDDRDEDDRDEDDHDQDDHVEDDHVEDDHVEDDHVEDDHVEDDHVEDDHVEDEHEEDDHDASFAEDARPHEASESSEDESSEDTDGSNESIVKQELEELGSDSPHGHLNLFSDRDENDDHNDSPSSSNPSISETPPPPQTRQEESLQQRPFDPFESHFDDEESDQHQDPPEMSPEATLQGLLDTQLIPQTQNDPDIDRNYIHEVRTWFVQEIETSSLKLEWQKIYRKGKWLRKQASRPMPEILKDPCNIVAEVRQIYKQVVGEDYLSSDQKRELRNLKDSLYVELERLTYDAMWETGNEATAWQIDQWEAHVVPKFINVLLLSFKVYRTLGKTAHGQFQDTLFVLIACALRIQNVARTKYLVKEDGWPNARAWTRAIRIPLKRILKDLKQQGSVEESTITQVELQRKPWTQDEGKTLVEGLQQYRGEYSLLSN